MNQLFRRVRAQRMTMINAILLMVMIIVVVQLWLLMTTMNAYLGGDMTVVMPAALVSLCCLALNSGFLWYVYRLE